MKLLMLLPILALVAAAPVSPDFDDPAPDEPQELAKSTLETMDAVDLETEILYSNPTVRPVQVYRNIICFPKKGCINMADVGIHP
ncbi:hypothetical protein Zmor_008425 [Zophobas morio]|uniref:Uncharacterized protein n=1 Tax=Zophobas morio TaxID=2755281 RepID=A0AA38J174_9CUCU|nr:hypothetical protein Zmor_008425 [Zophobas morio]